MEKHYKHLNAEERGVILAEHQRGSSLRQIGRLLGRHHGTIGLQLTRRTTPDGYDPHVARLARDAAQLRPRRQRKLVPAPPFYDRMRKRLIHWCWSLEQIAARLRWHASRVSKPACQPPIDRQDIASDIPKGGLSMPRSTRSRRVA
ncbi:MAG: IS30 family transposase [Yoonia sp.]|jgi:IS30 family transposase